MVAVAEASLESTVGADAQDKLAWAEMLNQATEKVNLAELERKEAAKLHTQKMQKLQEIEVLENFLFQSKPSFSANNAKPSKISETIHYFFKTVLWAESD